MDSFFRFEFNKTNINTRLLRGSIRSFLTENQIKCEAVNVSPTHFLYKVTVIW